MDQGESSRISMAALSPFNSANPSSVIEGTTAGIGNVLVGCACATAIVAVAPIKCGVDGMFVAGGANSVSGVFGAVAGVSAGLAVGSVAGAALVTGGVFSGISQFVQGVVHTPEAVQALWTGKDWDAERGEFVEYDLRSDARMSLMSEEDFILALKTCGSARSILALEPAVLSDLLSAERGSVSRRVNDTTLYDILGVSCDASGAEIKRRYYALARQYHPDKNPDDPQAYSRFQMVGEAYQILSDGKLRAAYDSRGKEVVEQTTRVDAALLYAIVFGSDKFEHLIGELQIASLVRSLTEPGSNVSSEMLAFRQRQREVRCAVALAQKLDEFVDGNAWAFDQSIDLEIRELCTIPLGAVLLSVIGQVYADCVNEEESTWGFLNVVARNSVTACANGCEALIACSNVAVNMLRLQQQLQAAEQRDLDSAMGNDSTSQNKNPDLRTEFSQRGNFGSTKSKPFGVGKNASAEQQAEYTQATKAMGASMISLLWHISKADIQATIRGVCRRVLHDHSEDFQRRVSRRLALRRLGQAYSAVMSDSQVALDDLLDRVAVQSGMFSANATSEKSSPAQTAHEDTAELLTKQQIFVKLITIESLPILELRRLAASIENAGSGKLPPIEKSELFRAARRRLLGMLGESDLKQLIILNRLTLNVENATKEELIDFLSEFQLRYCPQ